MRGASNRDGSFDMDTLVAGAQRLGAFGEQIGELATALQRATEGSKGSR